MTPTIDLNADVGEDPTHEGIARDAAIALHVTSLNIACGGHAGDEPSMRRLILLGRDRGLSIGAHPSFPDKENFGRVEMLISVADIEQAVDAQLSALVSIARSEDVVVTHVKPHGALYHAARRAEVAEAIARATMRVLPGASLIGQHGSPALGTWRALGCTVRAEAFADRRYEPDGTLRTRTLPGAVLSHDDAIAQALSIALDHQVRDSTNALNKLHADTLCLHSDTPGAASLAAAIRQGIASRGMQIGTPPTPSEPSAPSR